MKPIARIYSVLMLFALLALPATGAWANTAANTKIVNSATLTYNDGGGTKTAVSQVTVTVALKPAIPTITAGINQIGPYPTPLTDDYILTNNANGPDTFVLTTDIYNQVNGTVTAVPVGSPVSLGATVTIAGTTSNATRTFLVVPSDGTSDNSVNGIKLNATIVIDGVERTVRSITDNGSGTSIIEVDLLPAPLIATGIIGYVIGERVTVHATITPTATNPALNVTANVTMTAKSGTDNTLGATSGNVGNTFYPVSATLTKYVRNVTSANGSGSKFTLNGADYFKDTTGTPSVTAKPGEVLEYLLYASNGTATPVTQTVLTDLVPVDYVTLSTSVAEYTGKAFRYYPDSSVTSGAGSSLDFTTAQTDDAVDYSPTFDTSVIGAKKGKITAWIGGSTPTANNPGTIAGNKSIILLYRVAVN